MHQPGLHLGQPRPRPRPDQLLRAAPATWATPTWRRRATRPTAPTTTRTASSTSGATAGRACRSWARTRSWPTSRPTTTWPASRPTYGPVIETPGLPRRPAGGPATRTWTGSVENHDLGADGLADTGDSGEGDGMPTEGEPNFDGTDLNESDQIGLTGFKINRIRAGQGNPDQETDDIVFFTDNHDWPRAPVRAVHRSSDPDDRFDPPLASNYNIGFLFASGPFKLARRPDRALQPGPGLRRRPGGAGAQHPDRAADLQRQLPLRRAAAHADADRRGGRRLRAPVLGRRGRARRRPGDRRGRLRGLPHLPLHRSGLPRSPGDQHRHRHRAPGQRPTHRPVRSGQTGAAASPSRPSRAWPTTWAPTAA